MGRCDRLGSWQAAESRMRHWPSIFCHVLFFHKSGPRPAGYPEELEGEEKERCQGSFPLKSSFMVLRLMVATSSLSSSNAVSPERKKMPGTAAGTVRNSACTVSLATVS